MRQNKRRQRPKKRVTKTATHKKVVAKIKQQLKLSTRLGTLEQQQIANREIKTNEARFLTNLLLSVNALADIVVKKGLCTSDELSLARVDAAIVFDKEQKKEALIEKGELCICRCQDDEVCKCPCHAGDPCPDPRCKFCAPFREMVDGADQTDPKDNEVVKCKCGEVMESIDGSLVCPICLEGVQDELDSPQAGTDEASA